MSASKQIETSSVWLWHAPLARDSRAGRPGHSFKQIRTLIIAVALLLLSVVTVIAQRGATLRGQVKDQMGAVIVGASITLTDQNGKQQVAHSDDSGA
jgi:hypothetical protein